MASSMTENDLNLLSAYLDGELTPAEQDALEQRLAVDNDLRVELDSLEITVQLLKMAERVRVPRNFTLDPVAYGRPVHQGFWGWLIGVNRSPAFALGAAALAATLVAVSVLVTGQGAQAPIAGAEVAMEMAVDEPMAAQMAEEPFAAEAAEESVEEMAEEEALAEANPAEASEATTAVEGIMTPSPLTTDGLGGGIPATPPPGGAIAPSPESTSAGEADMSSTSMAGEAEAEGAVPPEGADRSDPSAGALYTQPDDAQEEAIAPANGPSPEANIALWLRGGAAVSGLLAAISGYLWFRNRQRGNARA